MELSQKHEALLVNNDRGCSSELSGVPVDVGRVSSTGTKSSVSGSLKPPGVNRSWSCSISDRLNCLDCHGTCLTIY